MVRHHVLLGCLGTSLMLLETSRHITVTDSTCKGGRHWRQIQLLLQRTKNPFLHFARLLCDVNDDVQLQTQHSKMQKYWISTTAQGNGRRKLLQKSPYSLLYCTLKNQILCTLEVKILLLKDHSCEIPLWNSVSSIMRTNACASLTCSGKHQKST